MKKINQYEMIIRSFYRGRYRTFYELIEGQDLNLICDKEGFSLGRIVIYQYSQGEMYCRNVLRILLNKGLNPDLQCRDSISLLNYSLVLNVPFITDMLLYYGANLDLQCDRGFTPLHYALIYRRHPNNPVEKLLLHGADRTIKDRFGRLPYDLALAYDDVININLLTTKLPIEKLEDNHGHKKETNIRDISTASKIR